MSLIERISVEGVILNDPKAERAFLVALERYLLVACKKEARRLTRLKAKAKKRYEKGQTEKDESPDIIRGVYLFPRTALPSIHDTCIMVDMPDMPIYWEMLRNAVSAIQIKGVKVHAETSRRHRNTQHIDSLIINDWYVLIRVEPRESSVNQITLM